jgi:hypothetical protein
LTIHGVIVIGAGEKNRQSFTEPSFPKLWLTI